MQEERLRKLAAHLKSGKLGHEIFDFGTFNSGQVDENGCGTAGCAIGECPIIWPEEWEFRYPGNGGTYYHPCLKSIKLGHGSMKSAEEFFGISESDAEILFIDHEDNLVYYPAGEERREAMGLAFLSHHATRFQVADNILKYIDYVKANS